MSLLLASVLASALTATPASVDPRLSILDAMKEELERNRTRLKLGENPPPYFISYSVKDLTQAYVAARYGALFDDSTNRDRRVFADVRVGSARDRQLGERGVRLQLLAQGHELHHAEGGAARRRPDRAAHRALADHRREVQGRALQLPEEEGRGVYVVDDPKKPPSFSRRAAEHVPRCSRAPFAFDRARWMALAREVSARFNEAAGRSSTPTSG